MSNRVGGIAKSGVAIGLLLLAAASGAFAKGPKIRVADDPSIKEGSPAVVLIEISDFQ
jgi:hypothetical protein